MIKIAIIYLTGKTLINALVKPFEPFSTTPGALAVYEIAPLVLRCTSTLYVLRSQIKMLVEGKTISACNADFDIGTIRPSLKLKYSEKLYKRMAWFYLI